MRLNQKTIMSVLLVLIMAVSALAGCGSADTGNIATQKNDATTVLQAKDLPLLEYSAWPRMQESEKYINNPNDVVTPYIEEKFNIKVSDVIISNTMTFKERLNTFIAADNVPDVIMDGKVNIDYAVNTGLFADLTDYIKDMPNLAKYADSRFTKRLMMNGKQYAIPQVEVNLNDPKYDDDPYNLGLPNWSLWVREDILAKCGYKFTPLDNIAQTNKKPTLEDLKIEPAIDTPDKFVDLLRKIKALNLKVGDKDVIPLSVDSWQQFHLGSMFDFGHWRIDSSGNADGYMMTSGAKDWYKMLTMMYRDGLIDKDFITQKGEQLQEKVSSGRVAVGMYVSDINAARSNMAQIDPSYKIRYIPWPKTDPSYGFFDVYEGGFERVIISNKVKDIKRLTQYFDWFYSDEGLDILTWGPESAGLWEMKDGKKVFKDKEVEADMLNATKGKKGADYWGLYDYTGYVLPYLNKAAICAPKLMVGNPYSYQRSYPVKIDVFSYAKALCGTGGCDYTAKGSYGDGGTNAEAASNYFWNKFQSDRVAKVLTTKTDADFDKVWAEEMELYLKEGKYEAAKADMTKWFSENYVK